MKKYQNKTPPQTEKSIQDTNGGNFSVQTKDFTKRTTSGATDVNQTQGLSESEKLENLEKECDGMKNTCIIMKRVLALFGVLICMLSFVACDKATGSEDPIISGTITRIDEDKIYDLTEEEVKIIADIIENGTWNTEGIAECANDCKLIIDERTYYYHSECGTLNDKEKNQNLPVTAEEKESINVILDQYITLGLE